MSVRKIKSSEFDGVIAAGGKVLVDFYADWCGPCRMVAPVVAEVANERADVTFLKVNVDEEGELAKSFGIYSIPTLVVIEGGREVRRATGAKRKEGILELLGS